MIRTNLEERLKNCNLGKYGYCENLNIHDYKLGSLAPCHVSP